MLTRRQAFMNFREVVIGAFFPVMFKSRILKMQKDFKVSCTSISHFKQANVCFGTQEEGHRALIPGGLMPKPLLFLLHPGRACVSSRIRHFVTPWTEAHQALLPMEFSRQEYWSGLPFLTAGNLPDPGIEPVSFESPALAGGFFITCATSEAPCTQHREYSLQLHLAVLQMSSPRIAHTILSLLSMLS